MRKTKNKKCFVNFCNNYKDEKTENIWFFKMTAGRYERWMRAIGRDPTVEKLTIHRLICSDHFKSEDLVQVGHKMTVKKDGLPTINLKPRELVAKWNPLAIDDPSSSFSLRKQQVSPIPGPSCSSINITPQLVSEELTFLIENPGDKITLTERSPQVSPDPGSVAKNPADEVTSRERPFQVSSTRTSGHIEPLEKIVSSPELERIETLSSTSTATSGSMLQIEPISVIPPHIKKPLRKRKIGEISSATDSEGLKGTPKKNRRLLREYHNYSISPRKMKVKFEKVIKEKKKIGQSLHTSKQRLNRLSTRIKNLKDVLLEVRKKNLASDDALEMLEKSHASVPLALVKRLLQNTKKGSVTREKFPEELRSFAMTLQFYSSKGYDFVRRTFRLALPSPSVIRSWMTNVDCEPGFSETAFSTLRMKVQDDLQNNRSTICGLMLDEMAIRQQLEFINGKTWGYVDIGCGVVDDNLTCATQALVLMVVSLNSHWKMPIAYFLIKSLNSEEKANIVQQALIKLSEVGIKITSLTFDGPAAHFAMAEKLGAEFRDLNKIKPYFNHPSTNEKIYIIFDACHMMKLMRNNWGTLNHLIDGNGSVIKFDYITKLQELQEDEGFRFGTKLRKSHMQWRKQKMKVNLAAQTLSNSVADALEFLMKDIKHHYFLDAGPTIQFIRTIDNLFDLCNSRNPFGRGCKTPLKLNNENYWRPILENCLDYLMKLTNRNGVPIYSTPNKTPIKGFIITGKSLLSLYDELVKPKDGILKYLLTYKMSQDHLELFFLNVRSRNGWNNNPTAYQFYHTYKRLLLVHDLKKLQGNCTTVDKTSVLTVTGSKQKTVGTSLNIDDVAFFRKFNLFYEQEVLEEHDYPYTEGYSTILSDNVVCYISGFVVKSVKKQFKCAVCLSSLESEFVDTDDSGLLLLKRKNRGGLIKPSTDVRFICREVEKYVKRLLAVNNEKLPQESSFTNIFVHQIFSAIVREKKCFVELDEHIYDTTSVLENHVYKLIKLIINTYIKIRFFNIAKKQTEDMKGELIRKELTKLILFRNQ